MTWETSSGVGDAPAGLRIEQVQMPGLDREVALLTGLGDEVTTLAYRHQLASLAEAAVQQRIGAQGLGQLDVELQRAVACRQEMLGPDAERHRRARRRRGRPRQRQA